MTMIRRACAVALAVTALLTMLAVRPAQASTGRYTRLPVCVTEDSRGPCAWFAQLQGNGRGRSFTVDARGRVHYVRLRLTWHRVRRYCTRPGQHCMPVPASARHDLGITRPALMNVRADITLVWERQPGGGARLIATS